MGLKEKLFPYFSPTTIFLNTWCTNFQLAKTIPLKIIFSTDPHAAPEDIHATCAHSLRIVNLDVCSDDFRSPSVQVSSEDQFPRSDTAQCSATQPSPRWLLTSAADDPSVSQCRRNYIRHYANQPVPYDFCVGIPISCLLTVGSTPVLHSVLIVS